MSNVPDAANPNPNPNPNPNTLAVFAKSLHSDAVKTRLAQDVGSSIAVSLYQSFVQDILDKVAKETLWETVLWTSDGTVPTYLRRDIKVFAQQGNNLGDRMRFALNKHLKTSKRVCVIGTDSPTLPVETIRYAFEQLRSENIVFGPASDGGYYLVGCQSGIDLCFEGVRFSTSAALKDSLRNAATQGHSIGFVQPWFDVDEVDDLRTLRIQLALQPDLAPKTAKICDGLPWF